MGKSARAAVIAIAFFSSCGEIPLPVAALSLVTGCASAPDVITRTEQVKVPVAVRVYCTPPETAPVALPISKLAPDTQPAETVRAYAESVAALKAAVKERDTALASCEAPK